MMRLAVVMEAALETGRGPLFRRLGMLAHMAARAQVHVIGLGTPDVSFRVAVAEAKVEVELVDAAFHGWTLQNAHAIAGRIAESATRIGCDAVVLDWELWDLVRCLGIALEAPNIPFVSVFHAVPFLNCPARPSGDFSRDVAARLRVERDPAIRRYIAANASSMRSVLDRTSIIAPNETVAFYLRHYFAGRRFDCALPGYAIDLAAIASVAPDAERTELVFMSKLVGEKGIFDLLHVLRAVLDRRPGLRLRLVGSFADPSEEAEFHALARTLGIAENLRFAGWLAGRDKYAALKSARVFVYTAQASDTFCISMLEALACGCRVVCYDLPFSREIYADAPVDRVPLGNRSAFAEAVTRRLDEAPEPSAAQFLAKYGSWSAVAEAELHAIRAIADRRARGETAKVR